MFTTEMHGNVLVMSPPAELVVSRSEEAKAFLTATVEDGHSQLVVDLAKMTFIDSSGLGVLIGAKKVANNAGGDVRLCGLSPQVQTIFQLTRLDRVFKTFATSDQAVASFD